MGSTLDVMENILSSFLFLQLHIIPRAVCSGLIVLVEHFNIAQRSKDLNLAQP